MGWFVLNVRDVVMTLHTCEYLYAICEYYILMNLWIFVFVRLITHFTSSCRWWR